MPLAVAILVKTGIAAATGAALVDLAIQGQGENGCCRRKRLVRRSVASPSIPPDEIDFEHLDDFEVEHHERYGQPSADALRAIRVGIATAFIAPALVTGGMLIAVKGGVALSLKNLAITEALFLPSLLICRVEDDEDGKLYRNLPLTIVAVAMGSYAITYTLAVFIYKHRIAFFPLISATGEKSPESIVFSLGIATTSVLLAGFVHAVDKYGYRHQSAVLQQLNHTAADYGYWSAASFCLVGIFRSGSYPSQFMHYPAALLFLCTSLTYCWIHTYLTGQIVTYTPEMAHAQDQLYRTRRNLVVAFSICGTIFPIMWLTNHMVVCAIFESSSSLLWSAFLLTYTSETYQLRIGEPIIPAEVKVVSPVPFRCDQTTQTSDIPKDTDKDS
eukprot:Sspe_Gene.44210::Locus_21662_Transcript_1_1_Confidence_1.000_Length_1363::g.44210::m.44210